MLVKKFEADTMAAALKQVKETLGAEALILSTRTLGKKGLGVLGKQTIEVTAAIESPALRSSSRQQQQSAGADGQKPRRAAQRYPEPALEDEQVTLSQRAQSQTEPKARSKAAQKKLAPLPDRSDKVEVKDNPLEEEVRQLRSQLEAQNVSQLQTEIEQLKTLMQQLSQPQPVAEKSSGPLAKAALPLGSGSAAEPSPRPDVTRLRTPGAQTLDDLVILLQDRGIDSEAAETIARFAAPQMSERQRSQPDQCRKYLSATLAGLVQTTGPLWSPGEPQKRVALIGATGVGKTTTIAKLAAEALSQGARVALVTIDTYRIAAVEQLKVYAEIMGLPVDVVLSPEQMQGAFRNHRDKDLILIDTAGRSPRDQLRIDELNEFLGQGAEVENCLVLAAPTDERLQQQSLEAFSQLPVSRLIFTKLDESDRCGSLINIPTRANLPLAYLANGQQVPEDLLIAEADSVADLVVGITEESGRIAV